MSVAIGRPSLLTPELQDQIATMIRAGTSVTVACEAAGISRETFYQWLKRGESRAAKDAAHREFRERISSARAEAEARAVTIIATAAREDWRAAAWLLERSFPERWGSSAERERLNEKPKADAPPDPFAEVDELAAARRRRGA